MLFHMHWLVTCILLVLSGVVPPAEQGTPPPRRSSLEFIPSKHGFHFRNSFTGSPLPPAARGLGLEHLVKMPARYGKCGGMSAAAADYFLTHTPIPPDTKPPKEGSELFGYITTRQIDSLGTLGTMTSKFMEMMAAPDTSPDAPSAASLTAPHIEPLLRRLEQGDLVAIGLVYVASPPLATREDRAKESTSPAAPSTPAPAGTSPGLTAPTATTRTGTLWDNHQVLAFASPGQLDRWNSAQACAEIRIYDPNFPDNDQVVIFVRKLPRAGTQPTQVSSEQRVGKARTIPVRGFFPMPYEPRKPQITPAPAPGATPDPAVR